jgi:RNA polymerase sigma factor (sigma-70 family)
MMKTEVMDTAMRQDDAGLVADCLSGNHDAFRQIVERYQTLLCSLAYCATGSISHSEDLAQETFVAAWKDLRELRERSRLKSWLCSILRFRISHQLRAQGREPIHASEPLDTVAAAPGPEATPSAQAMSHEEAAILWRSIGQLPDTYRVPLVLFYREHQSVEAVATNLDLTEDAVKQRLSRGRKMLQEQVLALVEGALARTNPGQAFTLAVLAALPAMTITAKAATLGATVKAGSAASSAGALGVAGALLAPLLALVGMAADYRLRQTAQASPLELKLVRKYYLGVLVRVVVFVALCTALMTWGRPLIEISPVLFAGLMVTLVVGNCILFVFRVRKHIAAGVQMSAEAVSLGCTSQVQPPKWEYRTRLEWFGWPLLHIRFGGWLGGRFDQRIRKAKTPVKAWIAITDGVAIGFLFAYGGLAIAPVSVGAMAFGLFSFGAFAVAGLAVGGICAGVWAVAPFAIGWQAFGGGCAIGWDAAWSGNYAIAQHFAMGTVARAAEANNDVARQTLQANAFFRFCLATMTVSRMITIIWVWVIPMMFSQIVQMTILFSRRQGGTAAHRQ